MAVKDTLVYVVMCLNIDNIKTKILAIKVAASVCSKYGLLIMTTKYIKRFYSKGLFIWEKVIPVGEKTFRLAK